MDTFCQSISFCADTGEKRERERERRSNMNAAAAAASASPPEFHQKTQERDRILRFTGAARCSSGDRVAAEKQKTADKIDR